MALVLNPPPFIVPAVDSRAMPAASSNDKLDRLLEGFGELRGTVNALRGSMESMQGSMDGVRGDMSQMGERQASIETRMEKAENAAQSSSRSNLNAYRELARKQQEFHDCVGKLEAQVTAAEQAAREMAPAVVRGVEDSAKPARERTNRNLRRVGMYAAAGALVPTINFLYLNPGLTKGLWHVLEHVFGGGAKLIDSSFGV